MIADISGYTRYMTANAKTLAHSQTIITELVKAILERVQLPLEIAKLEGDAVFLFCPHIPDALTWMTTRAQLSEKLLEFFKRFGDKLRELSGSIHCTCDACTHIEKLRLKVVVHHGEVLFHRVMQFNELAGVDVILVHRLLKNSVPADQYLLLTDAAMRELQFPDSIQFKPQKETYEGLGTVQTAFHDFDAACCQPAVSGASSFASRYRRSVSLSLKLWFGPLTSPRTFRNLPNDRHAAGRVGLAVLALVLSPLLLPTAALLGFYRAFRGEF